MSPSVAWALDFGKAPSVDVAAVVPGLVPYARTATRLHPRRGGATSANISLAAGPIQWPADQPWPMCHADLPGEGEQAVRQLDGTYRAVNLPPAFGARELPHPTPNRLCQPSPSRLSVDRACKYSE